MRVALEQEIASIAAFVIQNADNPNPYYYSVPEQFSFPAVYFPRPEILTRGETFRTYAAEYAWYINVLCKTTEEAHDKALAVLTAIKRARNRGPLLEQDGSLSGVTLRLADPSIKAIDDGGVQLPGEWTSRRPYADAEEEYEGATEFHSDITIR